MIGDPKAVVKRNSRVKKQDSGVRKRRAIGFGEGKKQAILNCPLRARGFPTSNYSPQPEAISKRPKDMRADTGRGSAA
jgi:hypothetical protein